MTHSKTAGKILVPIAIIFLIFATLAVLPLPWNQSLTDATADLQFRLRGDRPIFDDIVFVFIGAEDEQTFGGWPITRDWYGLLTYKLRQAKVKAIAFDILFKSSDPRYQEYDDFLATEFEAAGNICLAMTFGDLTYPGGENNAALPAGHEPILPMDDFRKFAGATGFSNLGDGAILRTTPLAVTYKDSIWASFGVGLAQQYLGSNEPLNITDGAFEIKDSAGAVIRIPLNSRAEIRLNHFGDIDQVNSIGIIDLLQALDTNPDSLDIAGKIMVVAPTSPRLPIIKATPLSDLFPATLIHLTVAENIIQGNYLREAPLWLHLMCIAGLILLALFVIRLRSIPVMFLVGVAGLLVFLIVTAFLFRNNHLILPLAYPLAAYGITLGYLVYIKNRETISEHAGISRLMKDQVVRKEADLKSARETLSALEMELQKQAAASDEQRHLAAERQREILQLESELRDLKEYMLPENKRSEPETFSGEAFDGIIHASGSKLAGVLALVDRIRNDDIPVLIEGETGTGKEMIARAIHLSSRRREKSFIAINCGALAETLLESELFGHEKGSFTGANSQRRGRFELANGGTIFLDEITETTPAFQARLLRVLQEGTFERVGGEATISVDVRVVAACNRDLQGEIEAGNSAFRPDLFYRLNGFPIKLPPLSERVEDIPQLAAYFLQKYRYDSVGILSARAMEALQNYHWPGNVRELENTIRRAAILAQSDQRDIIRYEDLPPEIHRSNDASAATSAYTSLEDQILEMLRSFQFSRSAITQTAKAMGNRDRGTITEYFRGICFQALTECDYDVDAAAEKIAGESNPETIAKVRKKIDGYLHNLSSQAENTSTANPSETSGSAFKGLPKKYHPYLEQVLENHSKMK